MGSQRFNRPPRVRPRWAAEAVDLPEPPSPPEPAPADWASMLLPLAGAGVFAGAASLNGGNPLLVALPPGAMALLGLGVGLLGQRGAARRARAAYAERRALFEDQLELGLARKDRRLAVQLADRTGVPGVVAPNVLNLLRAARGMGMGGEDVGAMIRVYERIMGKEVRK